MVTLRVVAGEELHPDVPNVQLDWVVTGQCAVDLGGAEIGYDQV